MAGMRRETHAALLLHRLHAPGRRHGISIHVHRHPHAHAQTRATTTTRVIAARGEATLGMGTTTPSVDMTTGGVATMMLAVGAIHIVATISLTPPVHMRVCGAARATRRALRARMSAHARRTAARATTGAATMAGAGIRGQGVAHRQMAGVAAAVGRRVAHPAVAIRRSRCGQPKMNPPGIPGATRGRRASASRAPFVWIQASLRVRRAASGACGAALGRRASGGASSALCWCPSCCARSLRCSRASSARLPESLRWRRRIRDTSTSRMVRRC